MALTGHPPPLVSSLPPPPGAERRAWGWSPGIPIRFVFRGDDRISQVPGEPQFPFAHDLRPRPADASLTLTERSHGPRAGNDEGTDNNRLSRLNSMAFGLAAYVSRGGYPPDRARLASGCWSSSPGRAFTRRVPIKGFQLTSCVLASSSELLGTIRVPTLSLGPPLLGNCSFGTVGLGIAARRNPQSRGRPGRIGRWDRGRISNGSSPASVASRGIGCLRSTPGVCSRWPSHKRLRQLRHAVTCFG